MAALIRSNDPGLFVALGGDGLEASVSSSNRVLRQLRVLANAVRYSAGPIGATRAVANRRLLALSVIAHSPGIGVKHLAIALGVRPPTASRVVKALAQLRLIEVEQDGRDRRAVRIHVSDEGRLNLRQFPEHFDFGDRLPEALTQLDDALLQRLESELTCLVHAITCSASALVLRGGPFRSGCKPSGKAFEC